MRFEVETYSYGIKYTERYDNMNNFESCVFINEGYFITEDSELISAKEIKRVREARE
jgi:hypothetical protein